MLIIRKREYVFQSEAVETRVFRFSFLFFVVNLLLNINAIKMPQRIK